MEIACLDLEGVLVPEIWIEFAKVTGIESLKATTRDIPDYDVLMKQRLRILEENNLGLKEIQDVIVATIELYLEQGDPIPEPINKEDFKGNISYRTSSDRHYSLVKLANEKHISMNKALDMVFDLGIKQIRI